MENQVDGRNVIPVCKGMLHVVEKGDTLYLLGKKYGVKVSALMMANPYVDIYNMQVGDEICIPKFSPVIDK